MKYESDFQTQFSKWKKYNHKCSSLYELKFTKTNSINFNRLEKHQELALLKAKYDEVCFKPPDNDFLQKPCDVLCVYKGGGYVVVMFYKPKVKHFYIIDIEDWIKEKNISKRKSLIENRANIIGKKHQLGVIE
jgi:hypothetical protein